jgi:hypothetical protein
MNCSNYGELLGIVRDFGIISAIATFLAVWLAYLLERKNREYEQKKIQGNMFLLGILCIQRIFKEVGSIIDKYESEIDEGQAVTMEEGVLSVPQRIQISPSRFPFDVGIFGLINNCGKYELIDELTKFLEAYDRMWGAINERNSVISKELADSGEIQCFSGEDGSAYFRLDTAKAKELHSRISSYINEAFVSINTISEVAPNIILSLLEIGSTEFSETPWRKIIGENFIEEIEKRESEKENK